VVMIIVNKYYNIREKTKAGL